MKKVLIIAYLFPPIGGGGVQRALKMAKYLQRFGVEASVLTVDHGNHVSLDSSLLEEIPKEVIIYRAREWKLPRPKVANHAKETNEVATANNGAKLDSKEKLFKRIKPGLKLLKEAVLIPDDQILWYRQAVKLGIEVVRKQKIDVVFSTSGPYTNHLVAKAIKQKTNVAWIADFRDPWTQNMHRLELKWRCRIEEHMERKVIEQADMLMTVTNSFAKNFQEKYQDKIKKLRVIHNGFDPDDYKNLKPRKLNAKKMTFIYTGIFYKERNPRLFLEAVAELIAEDKIDRHKISVQFAGVFDYPGYNENQLCVEKHSLADVVKVWGNLPHKEALSLVAGADQLLLIGDVSEDSGAYIPGKLFEYIAVKKPIFALTVEGETASIIRKLNAGRIISPFNKELIKQQLVAVYEDWLVDEVLTINDNAAVTLEYRRDEQARMLAEAIAELV